MEQKESKIVQEGWVLMTDTICQGPVISWKIEKQMGAKRRMEIMPEMFPTEEEARKSLVKEYIEHLQQFLDGEREWEHTDIAGPEEFIALCQIDEGGKLVVSDDEGNPIIETTLEQWQSSL